MGKYRMFDMITWGLKGVRSERGISIFVIHPE